MIQSTEYAIQAFLAIWFSLPLPFRALFGISLLFLVINLIFRIVKG